MENNSRPGLEAYLQPQEQLIIGAKINRLCETTAEDFEPGTQVQDAIDIIKALDSRVVPNGPTLTLSHSTSGSKSFTGATDLGNVNYSSDKKGVKKYEFGVREYKIGNYVATKYVGRSRPKIEQVGEINGYKLVEFVREESSVLLFEYYRDRNEINLLFDNHPEKTAIEYRTSPYELTSIGIWTPKYRTLQLGRASLTFEYGDEKEILWNKSENL